jgi:hypothetical protein
MRCMRSLIFRLLVRPDGPADILARTANCARIAFSRDTYRLRSKSSISRFQEPFAKWAVMTASM